MKMVTNRSPFKLKAAGWNGMVQMAFPTYPNQNLGGLMDSCMVA